MLRLAVYVLVLLAVFLAVAFGLQRCRQGKIDRSGRKDGRAKVEAIPTTDTFRVAEIKPIEHTAPVVVPPVVLVATKADSLLRRRLERSTIIVSVQKRKPQRKGFFRRRQGVDSLAIQTIDPKGIVSEATYPLRWTEPGEFTVDNAGRLHIDPAQSEKDQLKLIKQERRKRRWRTAKQTAVAVGVAVLGGLLIAR